MDLGSPEVKTEGIGRLREKSSGRQRASTEAPLGGESIARSKPGDELTARHGESAYTLKTQHRENQVGIWLP